MGKVVSAVCFFYGIGTRGLLSEEGLAQGCKKGGEGQGRDGAEPAIRLPRKMRWKLDFVRNSSV